MLTQWARERTIDGAVRFTRWMTQHFAKGHPFAVFVSVSKGKSPGRRVFTTLAEFAKANSETTAST